MLTLLGKRFFHPGDSVLTEEHLGLTEPYFAAPPPKSTGRDLFNEAWLRACSRAAKIRRPCRRRCSSSPRAASSDAVARHCRGARRVIVCGGGAKNDALMRRLADLVCARRARAERPPRHRPAAGGGDRLRLAAKRALEGKPGNLPSVTGAREAARAGRDLPVLGVKPRTKSRSRRC